MNKRGNYIRKKFQIKFSLGIKCFLLIGSIIVVMMLFLDIQKCQYLKGWIYEIIYNNDPALYNFVIYFKNIVSHNLDKLCDMLSTINTILAATVIFYYTVQDNQKEGIPHRAIMAYTFGSLTVPTMFILSIIMMVMNYLFCALHWNWACFAGICFTYVLQMAILILILLATSYQYSIHAICRAEIRQYQELIEEENTKWNRSVTDISEISNKQERIRENVQKVYFLHYIELVVKSDELVTDKAMLFCRLLMVPFCKKPYSFFWEEVCEFVRVPNTMIEKRLESNNIKMVYDFYYLNLLPAFEYLSASGKEDERNKVYSLLYDFFIDMENLYEKAKKRNDQTKCCKNYLMTISGVLNAVLTSNALDKEAFCNYVFNYCIADIEILNKQLGLYFLFQEYLYRTNEAEIRLESLVDIEDKVKSWKMKGDYKELYIEFWKIWTKHITLSEENSYLSLWKALKTLEGNNLESIPISYIMLFRVTKTEV